jgi:hypothetical protein
MCWTNYDGFVKSPHAALRRILRHCSVPQVRFIPQDLRALPANFLRSRLKKVRMLRQRRILRHCSVRQVRFIPCGFARLACEHFTKSSITKHSEIFFEFCMKIMRLHEDRLLDHE